MYVLDFTYSNVLNDVSRKFTQLFQTVLEAKRDKI